MTVYAKLSVSAAASLKFVRTLQNEETHRLVRSEVFDMAKAQFGIPAKHKITVELDPDMPDYLLIIRKVGREKYELDDAGRWVGAEPLPPENAQVWVLMSDAQLQDAAIALVDESATSCFSEGELRETEDDLASAHRVGCVLITRNGTTYVRVDSGRFT